MAVLDFFKKIRLPFCTALRSPAAHAVLFALAVFFHIKEKPVLGAVVFLSIAMVYLIVCDDFCSVMLPLLFPAAFTLTVYDGYSQFAPYMWMLVPTGICFLFHLTVYRRPIVLGEHFSSAVAVTVALTLGGLFSISAQEYFSGAALYHVLMLGVGMLLLYILMRSDIEGRDVDAVFSRFALYMYLWGLFATFMVGDHILTFYLEHKELLLAGKLAQYFQWRNNISTVLLLCMPFPLFFARRNPLHILPTVLMFFAALCTTSRGGVVCALCEMALLLPYAVCVGKGKWRKLSGAALLLAVAAVAFFLYRSYDLSFLFDRLTDGKLIHENEARVQLFRRSVEDFKAAPIFGRGIGYAGNSDLYSPKQGAMYFYHMFVPQVIGSMGCIGILAYLWQILLRVRCMLLRIDYRTVCLFLSYIGIFLMSQVNPGEFVPLPYELITVALFVLMEKQEKRGLFKPLFYLERKSVPTVLPSRIS